MLLLHKRLYFYVFYFYDFIFDNNLQIFNISLFGIKTMINLNLYLVLVTDIILFSLQSITKQHLTTIHFIG